tara:strand:+ start:5747 stop:5953 length:207 start_codon:yes stop_codon:yes gene_type:complete
VGAGFNNGLDRRTNTQAGASGWDSAAGEQAVFGGGAGAGGDFAGWLLQEYRLRLPRASRREDAKTRRR